MVRDLTRSTKKKSEPLRPYLVCTAKHRENFGYDCPARATRYNEHGEPVCDAE